MRARLADGEANRRLATALAFIAGIDIQYPIGSTSRRYERQSHLLHAVLPQCAFHATIACARSSGAVVGARKSDDLAR